MRIMMMSVLCVLLFSTLLMADDNCDKMFCTLDTNHDNVLNKKEFADGKVTVDRQKTVQLFPELGDVEHMNDRKLKESLFDRMDKNHDGLLSRDEWRQVAPNILEINF
jgi:Ca2+-binding EF-hand superfamily protein